MKNPYPCKDGNAHCLSCPHHYAQIRPFIRGISFSHHFIRDIKHHRIETRIIKDILDCSLTCAAELHKFERHVHGTQIYRAKHEHCHILYGALDDGILVFIRAMKNFTEYRQFLSDTPALICTIENRLPTFPIKNLDDIPQSFYSTALSSD